ncbi:MAG: glycine oxidase ThiO [Alphaproteobacteria bacterium]|nr:glycine oxidase ThiO [Alphaproteobacteria bacterium]
MPLTETSAKRKKPTVAIVGAGVCGLGIGWRLAAAGCAVDVFDRAEPGRGASWAAAGMLAARAEVEPGEEDLLALNLESQDMWPAFAAELEAASGVGVDYRDEGTMIVGLTRDDAEALEFTFDLQRRLGLDVHWIGGAEAREREPFLTPNVTAGIYSPGDHQVDNRKLVQSLAQAYLSAGGALHPNTEVLSVDIVDDRVRGVVTGGDVERFHAADIVLIAAGAWSHDIAGLPKPARPPVRPLKGQMLSLRMERDAPLLSHVLWAPGVYLVPRLDGELIVGATVEEKGFDATLTGGGILDLLRDTWEALPGMTELPIEEMWVGHRPTSRDDAPILGPTPVEGLVMATGHHRNGILLTPITVDAVSRFILDGTIAPAIERFTIDRFAASRRADPEIRPSGARLGVVP